MTDVARGQSSQRPDRRDTETSTDDVLDNIRETADHAAEKVSAAAAGVGGRLRGAAQTLREKSPSGAVGTAAGKVAGGLERAGSYLERQDFSELRGELENLVRRYPLEALALGLGAGFMLARSLRR